MPRLQDWFAQISYVNICPLSAAILSPSFPTIPVSTPPSALLQLARSPAPVGLLPLRALLVSSCGASRGSRSSCCAVLCARSLVSLLLRSPSRFAPRSPSRRSARPRAPSFPSSARGLASLLLLAASRSRGFRLRALPALSRAARSLRGVPSACLAPRRRVSSSLRPRRSFPSAAPQLRSRRQPPTLLASRAGRALPPGGRCPSHSRRQMTVPIVQHFIVE